MYCQNCNSLYSGAQECPRCHPASKRGAKKAPPKAAQILPTAQPRAAEQTAAPVAPSPEVETQAQGALDIGFLRGTDEQSAMKRFVLFDAIKWLLLAIGAFIFTLTPFWGENLFEYFFECIEEFIDYGEFYALGVIVMFVWAVTIIVRCALRFFARTKIYGTFDDKYISELSILDGDELLVALAGGKSKLSDLILVLELAACIIITLFVAEVGFDFVDASDGFAILPLMVLAAAAIVSLAKNVFKKYFIKE